MVPYGWLKFLIGFALVAGGLALGVYLYGRATRPAKAGQYALAAATHLFIWVVILLTLYPVINLVAVSLNRSNNLNSPPPAEGNLLVRAGLLPDPNNFSLVQYAKVTGETHLTTIQWLLAAVLVLAVLGVAAVSLLSRTSETPYRLERLRTLFGWTLFAAAAALVVSIGPDQFYRISETGERVASASDRKVILFIRNTLLVSGITGIFAVLISTTAGYAFARMKFDGRYGTLLTFIFVQMFPGFMALVAIFYLMNYLGLLNTFTGLILAYSGGAISFAAWIFKGYLESISSSLEEAAMVDGATRWGAFWRVILPISVPMLLFIFPAAVHRHLQRVHPRQHPADRRRHVDGRHRLAEFYERTVRYAVGRAGGKCGFGQLADSLYLLCVPGRADGAVHGGRGEGVKVPRRS